MLTGVLVPTAGEVTANGTIPWKDRERYVKKVGILFGNRGQLWNELSPDQSFDLLRRIYEIDPQTYRKNLSFLMETLNLQELLNRPLRELSLGQRMRCELAAVFLHSPEIVFLDEPTIGLDFEAKKSTREIIRKLNRENGTTVIFTSHDLRDIEEVCERIILINKGRILHDGGTQDMKRIFPSNRKLRVEFRSEMEKARFTQYLNRLNDPELLIKNQKDQMEVSFRSDRYRIVDFMAEIGDYEQIGDISIEDGSIEDIISGLLGKTGGGPVHV